MKVLSRSLPEETLVPICKGCFYSREIGSEVAVACHRYPPTITKVEDTRVTSHFPLVGNEIWCGEYREQQSHMEHNVPVRTVKKESRK